MLTRQYDHMFQCFTFIGETEASKNSEIKTLALRNMRKKSIKITRNEQILGLCDKNYVTP